MCQETGGPSWFCPILVAYNVSNMTFSASQVEAVRKSFDRRRLIDTAVQLVAVPSPTGEAGCAADRLAQLLAADGFTVERPAARHPAAPAVVVRLETKKSGPTLQFDGHLDTVHLPFVPPAIEGDRLTGSGASDMKSGVAAAVEALRVLRDLGTLFLGSILFTAHDLHEAPWGFGEQLDGLIAEGYVGDAVLIPEPLSDRLPVIGRGAATWKVDIQREGEPVHEVMRPLEQPSVIAAGAELVSRLNALERKLATRSDPLAGAESVFIGQLHSGEIYNGFPKVCWLEGTRRWLPDNTRDRVEQEFRDLMQAIERDTKTTVSCQFRFIRDAFFLDQKSPLVSSFQDGYKAASGRSLEVGPKPFVDDGNCFWGRRKIPAITHGPKAGGQHTVHEWVSLDDLERVAMVYCLTAISFCSGASIAR
jgi:acetylornithine deacetylase/succinyl-diaminopimelate desuccinylase-like protein